MISGAAWIRKGAANPNPTKFAMTEEQYEEIMARAKFEIGEAKESLAKLQKDGPAMAEDTVEEDDDASDVEMHSQEEGEDEDVDLSKFDLDHYDDDDGVQAPEDMEGGIFEAFSTVDAAALGGEDDPYLAAAAAGQAEKMADMEDDEDEEDKEDLKIKDTDTLIVTCRTEDDLSHLEVYVYEEGEDNLYVHHDIMLSAFPLCVEWIGTPMEGAVPSTTGLGNFAAVGTFEPEIEIWNLDVLEVPYPTVILGQKKEEPAKGLKKKSKSSAATKIEAERHTGAVMSLSWNKLSTSMLLSGSADTSVKLWDITETGKCLRSFTHHTDKVQTLQWNPREASVLASAAYDHQCAVFDCRTPNERLQWKLQADPECLKWNPHCPEQFFVSDESGRLQCFDSRLGSGSAPLFTLSAHSKALTAFDINPALPSCLMTASSDRTMKLWNLTNNQPVCVVERSIGAGKIFTAGFCPDAPNLVYAAGSKGVLSVVNLYADQAIVEAFQGVAR